MVSPVIGCGATPPIGVYCGMEIKLPSGVTLRPIPSAPNVDYMAGSDGQVYSQTRYAGFGKKIKTDWYPLSGHRTAKGYRSITMSHESQRRTRNVHRLICEAFHGQPQRKSLQVRHLDGNPDNNAPPNLAWGTQEENWQDRRAHGRVALGEKHHAAKLTDAERTHLAWAIARGLCSQRHAARMLGMSQSAIQEIAAKVIVSG